MAMALDVYDLRHSLAAMAAGAMTSREDREWLAADVLRILDAFEAMERERWFIDISPTLGTWYAMGGEGSVITEGHMSPLAALLAAAEALKQAKGEA